MCEMDTRTCGEGSNGDCSEGMSQFTHKTSSAQAPEISQTAEISQAYIRKLAVYLTKV